MLNRQVSLERYEMDTMKLERAHSDSEFAEKLEEKILGYSG